MAGADGARHAGGDATGRVGDGHGEGTWYVTGDGPYTTDDPVQVPGDSLGPDDAPGLDDPHGSYDARSSYGPHGSYTARSPYGPLGSYTARDAYDPGSHDGTPAPYAPYEAGAPRRPLGGGEAGPDADDAVPETDPPPQAAGDPYATASGPYATASGPYAAASVPLGPFGTEERPYGATGTEETPYGATGPRAFGGPDPQPVHPGDGDARPDTGAGRGGADEGVRTSGRARGAEGSLVRIHDLTGRPRGTGFPADHHGTVVTSHDAVRGLPGLLVRAGDRTCRVPADAVIPLPELDLALVRTEGLGAEPFPIGARERVTPGAYVRIAAGGPREARVLGPTPVTYTDNGRAYRLDGALELAMGTAAQDALRMGGAATGGPVVDAATGTVVAVLGTALRSQERDIGFAVPLCARTAGLPTAAGVPLAPHHPLAELLVRNAETVSALGDDLNLAGVLELTGTSIGQDGPGGALADRTGPAGAGSPAAQPPVERADVVQELTAFAEGRGSVLALVGTPGSGRTTELAAFAARRTGGSAPAPTLWLRGADLEATDGSVADAARRSLERAARIVAASRSLPPEALGDLAPERLARLARRAGRPLLLLLDGPEEMPPVLAHRLPEWTEGTAAWLCETEARLVVACREEYWETAGAEFPPELLHPARPVASGPLPLPPCVRLADLTPAEAREARRRYGVPEGALTERAARHPLTLRLHSEVRAALPDAPAGPPADRHDVLSAHLDLMCLRIAVRLAAGNGLRGTAVRRLAARVSGQVHEAARRSLGPGQGELDRESFEAVFPWGPVPARLGGGSGWASAVLTEGLLVPAGSGYRFAHEELADWIQGMHLDLDGALRALVHRRRAPQGSHPLPVPHHRVGPVVQALLLVDRQQGPDQLVPRLQELVYALELDPTSWWAARLLAESLLGVPDATPYTEVLRLLADRIVSRRRARQMVSDGFGPAFWTALPIAETERFELLRHLVLADDAPDETADGHTGAVGAVGAFGSFGAFGGFGAEAEGGGAFGSAAFRAGAAGRGAVEPGAVVSGAAGADPFRTGSPTRWPGPGAMPAAGPHRSPWDTADGRGGLSPAVVTGYAGAAPASPTSPATAHGAPPPSAAGRGVPALTAGPGGSLAVRDGAAAGDGRTPAVRDSSARGGSVVVHGSAPRGRRPRYLDAVADLLVADPRAVQPHLIRWFDDERPLPATPHATVATAAQALLHTHRHGALDDLTDVLVGSGHRRAEQLLAVLAEDEPTAVCRAVDRWAHDDRPARRVAAVTHGLRAAPHVRTEPDAALLRYAALTLLARPADRALHGGALALLVRDPCTRPRHLAGALRHFAAGDPRFPPSALVPALVTHPDPVLEAFGARLRTGADTRETLRALADVTTPALARRVASLVCEAVRSRPAVASHVAEYVDGRIDHGPAARAVLLPLVTGLVEGGSEQLRAALAGVLTPQGAACSRPLRRELLDFLLEHEREPAVLDALLHAAAHTGGVETAEQEAVRDLVHRTGLLLAGTPEGATRFDRGLIDLGRYVPGFAALLTRWLTDTPEEWAAVVGPSTRRMLGNLAEARVPVGQGVGFGRPQGVPVGERVLDTRQAREPWPRRQPWQ